ncbi:MAG: MBOAT family protein [Betaproteobacteria bacterium]|nr:MBOAT family protein [Betaproteobacteria bacterium]MDH3436533.1 MBOAT family protein [Betaproteobacteria bacterium]
MLFNSYPFLLVFLPLTLAGFFLIARASHVGAAAWLALASLAFYGWWNPVYVLLLLASILFNFFVGRAIVRTAGTPRARRLLIAGVATDLLLLGYYKYMDFFVSNLNHLGAGLPLPHIVLPLGISFFTFTQIAFLADAYQGKAAEYRFAHYCLFVTYFPHLIAGPILHHKEMMPQFGEAETYRLKWENLSVGLTIFFIGLFKKTVIADGVAVYVGPVFSAYESGARLPLLDAWAGVVAFSFQVYFDFSAYSDMAIGLSLIFGVRLPLNFHSPYKAVNMTEMWQRWHMTLTRFLRNYIFVPLGGMRKSAARRYYALFVTFVLCGIWHGAGWTFVVFGALHGFYLCVNQAWRLMRKRRGWDRPSPTWWGRMIGVGITFVAWLVGCVFFRSETLQGARYILEGMAGMHGLVLPYRWLESWGPVGQWLMARGVEFQYQPTFGGGGQVNWILLCFIIVWFMPNTQQIMGGHRPALALPADVPTAGDRWWQWRPTWAWLAFGVLAAVWGMLSISGLSEFIYFQF